MGKCHSIDALCLAVRENSLSNVNNITAIFLYYQKKKNFTMVYTVVPFYNRHTSTKRHL